MEETIREARQRNPLFNELSTQAQYEYIRSNIDPDILKEELEWYYDRQFGCPYDDLTLKRKTYASQSKKLRKECA